MRVPKTEGGRPSGGIWRGAASAPLVLAALAGPAAGEARALDRERAVPASTLEPCPSKGPGFVRTPGSRTCNRVSSRVSAGAEGLAGPSGTGAAPMAAGRLSIDSRTGSDLGEVRTYLRLGTGRR